jgi:hypothetical protein
MLEHNQAKRRENEQFTLVLDKVKRMNDQKSLELIGNFDRLKKESSKDIHHSNNKADIEKNIETLKLEHRKLYDELLDHEMQLVEQNEEFIREFEARMSELTGHALETIRG